MQVGTRVDWGTGLLEPQAGQYELVQEQYEQVPEQYERVPEEYESVLGQKPLEVEQRE